MKLTKFVQVLFSLVLIIYCTQNISAQDFQKELSAVKSAQNTFLQTQLNERITKISNTPDFVRAANVSVNALVLSNSLSDYLNDVSSLNNPNNADLGFSLSQKVTDLLASNLFKDPKKKGFSRFMDIASGIIQHPLVSSLTSALPIVSSLNSVMNLVNNAAIQSPEMPIDDVNKFRDEISKFVAHYQGLADATTHFQAAVIGVQERSDELQITLKSFTTQRIGNLYPAKMESVSKETSLRKVLVDVYEKEKVVKTVQEVLVKYNQNGATSQELALTDPQLVYPEYAVNEARFIYDELNAVSQEYVNSFNEYNNEIIQILEKSKTLGNSEKIDKKIALMKDKLSKVEEAFLNAVHVEEVESRFKALARTHIGG